MPFNVKEFTKANFQARTVDLKFPALAAWFDADEPPVFTVRGLTGQELGRVYDASSKNNNLTAIVEAIASDKDKSEAIKKVVGLNKDETPVDVINRLEMAVAGCVNPQIDLDVALLILERFPFEFYKLTTEINHLTGRGMEVKK